MAVASFVVSPVALLDHRQYITTLLHKGEKEGRKIKIRMKKLNLNSEMERRAKNYNFIVKNVSKALIYE